MEWTRAVFLSYASQDAEAARRICDALRAAGVEVWFDQSELRGGDAWDGKIRRQIKECALFVPIISANTQARAEGYFRLEWKLAVDRSHQMADDATFILPVVIDDTPSAAARVPDKFRERQWVRIDTADSSHAFCVRVGKLLSPTLLGGTSSRESAKTVSSHVPAASRDLGPPAGKRKGIFMVAAAIALAAIGFVALRPTAPNPANSEPRTQPALRSLGEEGNSKLSNPPPSASKSVAVLAFADLSAEKDGEYFSDGISEELLNVLAKVPGLRVAARTSAFYFKGKNTPIPDIAKQLNVGYVVEGSVRKAGSRVRITAQLISAADGFHVWSDNFDRELKDIFAVQDEIAGLIAQKLQLKLGTPRRTTTVNPEAYRLVLEGWHFWSQRTEEGFDRAERAFTQALQLDPQFVRAQLGLADLWAIRGWYHTERGLPDASMLLAQAESATRRALQLDPALTEVHATIGAVHLVLGRVTEAEQEINKCLAAAPNYATARNWHGDVMLVKGRLDLAIEDFLLAARLDPLSPIMLMDCARVLRDAGRFAESLEFAERCLALSPESLTAMVHRAQALLDLGRRSEALAAVRKFAAMPGASEAPGIVTVRAVHVLRQCGDAEEAGKLAAVVASHLVPDSFFHGFLLAALGRHDEALPFLGQSPRITFARTFWDPAFDPLREHPGFQRILERLGCAEEYKVARQTLERMLAEQPKQ